MGTDYEVCHARAIIGVDLCKPPSTIENRVRSKAEDFDGVLTVTHLVRRKVPIECHYTAGPKCLLEPMFPLQDGALVKPPLAKQRRKHERAERGGQNGRLSGQDPFFERQQKCQQRTLSSRQS